MAALCLLLAAFEGRAAEPVFPPHPRLATSAEEWRADQAADDFAARRDASVKAAASLLAQPLPLPEGFGSWVFYYACPDDGADLRMLSLTEHECPRCKKKYGDPRTNAAYRCLMHHQLEHGALKLAWAYAYSGDDRYAVEVRRILLHLADEYATYPARQDRWGRTGWFAPLGGRRYVQSLDEAVGVIRLAKAYDLTCNAKAWSADDREKVERDFFRATAKTLLAFNQGINNHQTWYNAGLMAIASVLADAEMVEQVLTMRGGFRDQLQRSLGDDGLWYEGAMAYQNYALQAMVEIVDAGRRMGLPLQDEPRFKALLLSSLKVAYPNGQYPAINDSDPLHFRSFNWSYEWAFRTYGDPAFAQAAAWGNPAKLKALLGPQAEPEWPLETASIDLANVGLAVLRAGKGAEQTCVFFDYGRHGEGHGHYDKLNITLFANGREWLLDPGRIGYSFKEYKSWVKHTVAHNTVVIDESNQWATTGKLRWLQTGDDWSACSGECDTAWLGVHLQRSLWLSPQLLIEVFEVQAGRDLQMDWLAHAVTEPVASVQERTSAAVDRVGKGPGYKHLTETLQWDVQGDSQWDFPAGKQRLRIWLPAAAEEEVYTGIGVGSRADQKAPFLLRRRQGKTARFVTVYDLGGDGKGVTRVQATNGKEPTIRVVGSQGTRSVVFTADGVRVE
ncbi:heparinase II/III domain-containing protein [Lignipirellula cremea]|uniref:Heparin-sulfate lyase n=1 Tax=Lignipirellula cremea TaxID=2528010 RepID=A0A518DXS5_9BACT|nr:heparinase II/III family protein [Lignipirellula cremea]QDU96657.1 Heparin-sulfate lyase precursor [Lignipirellula cremea]